MRKLKPKEIEKIASIIKQKSLNNRKLYKDKNVISIFNLLESVKPIVDWDKVATKCSQNPNHELYGKTPEDILEIWNTRKNDSSKGGIRLDEFIGNYIKHGIELKSSDDEMNSKFNTWKHTYDTLLSEYMSHIGSEMWLNSSNGFRGRLDALMGYVNDNKELVLCIIDWKNMNEIPLYNDFQKLLECCSDLDSCKGNVYTLQTHMYRYILEEFGFKNVTTRIVQITENKSFIIQENFKYSKERIENIIELNKL